jgi:adenine-specific DNA-methyltransferase
MRYIGSKENLLGFIESAVSSQGITGGTFCDLFAGTTTVGRHFKRRGFRVISNDLMEYSFVFSKAYLENNALPTFAGLGLPRQAASLFDFETDPLQGVLDYLNQLLPEPGFIFENYSDVGTAGQPHERMYFSAVNAAKIDAVRNQVQQWHDSGAITDSEFYILLASLLEAVPSVSNTTGIYAAFLNL